MKHDEYAEKIVAERLPGVYEAHPTANDLELAERVVASSRLDLGKGDHVALVDRVLHVVRRKRSEYPRAS